MTSKDLWIFRYLTCSRLVLSLPFIGSFATQYFSHLFDFSRFAATLFFAVVRQLTINYSLTTGIHQSLLIRSVIRTFNIDFNWFLTCLDINSFKHFILLFYYMFIKQWEKEKKYNCIYGVSGGWGVEGYSNIKLIYMSRTGFKNAGGGSGTSLKMEGFQSGHSREKQGILEIKITKKRIFFKTRVFSIYPGRKSRTKNCIFLKKGSFGAAQVENVESPPRGTEVSSRQHPFNVTCVRNGKCQTGSYYYYCLFYI